MIAKIAICLLCVLVGVILTKFVQKLNTSEGKFIIDMSLESDQPFTIQFDDGINTIAACKYVRLKVENNTESW